MIEPEFKIGKEKSDTFKLVEDYLHSKDFRIASSALDKPWGGYYVLNEADAARFAYYFFPVDAEAMLNSGNKLSPKILVVAPGKRLSWQYHFRRAEIWKLIAGVAGVVISESDQETGTREIQMGEIVRLKVGERHRLVGLPDGWGAVAEIWQHTDYENPSDESDIVRLQDDYNRA
jgi:mannose-6-phosphate isomerase-like protein (cupin superfamily)